MCLCIGPTGSGKTLLLRRLHKPEDVDAASTTVATVGANLIPVWTGQGKKRIKIEIRELGGSIAPMWPAYYRSTYNLIFVIDAADKRRVADAAILLMEAMAHTSLQKAQFLVVLTKRELTSDQECRELQEILRLEELKHELPGRLEILETSARTGEGTEKLMEWLNKYEGRRMRILAIEAKAQGY